MNIKYLKVTVMGIAAALLTSVSLSAFEAADPRPDVRSISGVISSIDIKLGTMQLSSDSGQATGGMADYTVNLQKTLVTDPSDQQFLVPKDLRAGQHVTVESFNNPNGNPEEIVARNIIVGPMAETTSVATTTITNTTNTAVDYNYDNTVNERDSLVGPRGSTGPSGSVGNQGFSGSRGQSGVALRGARGETGAAGSVGEQGFTGPRGPMGNVARGPVGEVGPSGPRGQQGEVGRTGEQGSSLSGYAGSTGATGPRGERGPVGDMGAKGPTLYGPTGPAGYAGSAGRQGAVGETGSAGRTAAGIAGSTGYSGAQGARGEKGATGSRGVAGKVGYWELYKEFNFYSDETRLSAADMKKVNEIAYYIKENPSLQVGIDGTAVRSRDQNLNDLRVNAIWSALINAGVPSNKIKTGALGDRNLRREGRIAVFFITS